MGVSPSTVLQRSVNAGGREWRSWLEGSGSPTLKTANKVLVFVKDSLLQIDHGSERCEMARDLVAEINQMRVVSATVKKDMAA